MDYRPFGRTGLKVSKICLGTMTWGEQNTEAEGHAQMDYALDQGINFFDTAELYSIPPKAETQGSTERFIGNWFKSRGTRDKVILASKVVGRTPMEWFRNGRPSELSKADMTYALEQSLKRLQTDYIDLYQLHWPDRPAPWGANPTNYKQAEFEGENFHSFQSILETLDGFVKAGKVRHVGLSNESAWGTMKFIHESEKHGLPRMASIQNAYNLLNRTYEVALAEISYREQVALLAYSPLGQGYLTGKYRHGARPAGARTTLFNRGQRYEKPGAAEAIEAYWALAQEVGLDLTTMALAYVNDRSFVTSNIIGATKMEQLKHDIASAEVKLSQDVIDRIDAIHQVHMNPAP